MGFSVQTVIVRGRPTSEQLAAWTARAAPRLQQPRLQLPDEKRPRLDHNANLTLQAAPRVGAKRPEDFTLLWMAQTRASTAAKTDRSLMSFGPLLRLFGLNLRDGRAWGKLPENELPKAPKEAAGGDPFLVTLALLAHAEGLATAFFADSSVSDSGCVLCPLAGAAVWTEEDSTRGRETAEALLRKTFGADAPNVDELQWAGGTPFWAKPLVVAGERVIGR